MKKTKLANDNFPGYLHPDGSKSRNEIVLEKLNEREQNIKARENEFIEKFNKLLDATKMNTQYLSSDKILKISDYVLKNIQSEKNRKKNKELKELFGDDYGRYGADEEVKQDVTVHEVYESKNNEPTPTQEPELKKPQQIKMPKKKIC